MVRKVFMASEGDKMKSRKDVSFNYYCPKCHSTESRWEIAVVEGQMHITCLTTNCPFSLTLSELQKQLTGKIVMYMSGWR